MALSVLAKMRITDIRKELEKGEVTAISARDAGLRNIAGERAIETLGREKVSELLEQFDAGNEEAGVTLTEACR